MNIEDIKSAFYNSADLKYKKISICEDVLIVYLDGLTDKEMLERSLINPLINSHLKTIDLQTLQSTLTYIERIEKVDSFSSAIDIIADGDLVMFVKDDMYFLSFKSYPTRSISEPETSLVVKGPREGFIEDLKQNMVLLRRKLRTNKFVFKTLKVGRYTKTSVAVCYIEGVVNNKLVG